MSNDDVGKEVDTRSEKSRKDGFMVAWVESDRDESPGSLTIILQVPEGWP